MSDDFRIDSLEGRLPPVSPTSYSGLRSEGERMDEEKGGAVLSGLVLPKIEGLAGEVAKFPRLEGVPEGSTSDQWAAFQHAFIKTTEGITQSMLSTFKQQFKENETEFSQG